MRLEDLQAQFGGGSRGGFNGNSRGQDRGYYSQDSREVVEEVDTIKIKKIGMEGDGDGIISYLTNCCRQCI